MKYADLGSVKLGIQLLSDNDIVHNIYIFIFVNKSVDIALTDGNP